MCRVHIRKDQVHNHSHTEQLHPYIRRDQVRIRNHSHMPVHYKRGKLP